MAQWTYNQSGIIYNQPLYAYNATSVWTRETEPAYNEVYVVDNDFNFITDNTGSYAISGNVPSRNTDWRNNNEDPDNTI